MSKWHPAEYDIERAEEKTRQLRTSAEPQWVDARRRLEELDISPGDAVLASWEPEGGHLMCGVIGARDGRLLHFCVVYGYDEGGRPLEKGVGRISSWDEIPADQIGPTSAGYPNSWAQHRLISQMVFDLETRAREAPQE